MQIFTKRHHAFTLIELLVVISIFGLIVSLVVVFLQSSKDKARIANILTYSATIKHSLGADIVGEWRFEEGSGNSVSDSSGQGNNGTWQGTGIHWEQNSIHELGKTGKFNGDDDYVLINDSNSLDVKSQITIESWIKTSVFTANWMVANKRGAYALGYVNGSGARCIIYGLLPNGVISCANPFQAAKWHHFVCTYDGKKVQIIVDGKQCGSSKNASGNISQRNDSLIIGRFSVITSGYFFNGNIDEVRIYERGLTAIEIQKHYAEGAKKREIAAND